MVEVLIVALITLCMLMGSITSRPGFPLR